MAPLPDKISKDEFQALLARYPSVAADISAAKGAKSGQKTLQDLDTYRYEEAPKKFGDAKSSPQMTLGDVQALVEWKLRHGKFRPTLMKLVTSNDPSTAKSTIHSAITTYRTNTSKQAASTAVPTALDTLTKLRGIGPATASLLLSVHDADNVIFFSDEAFYWLCGGGRKDTPIKYNAKEYAELRDKATKVKARLGVSSVTDVEKVAYVIMKGADGGGAATVKEEGSAAQKKTAETKPKPKVKPEAVKEVIAKKSGAGSGTNKEKRKPEKEEADGLRRSKRQRG